MNTLLQFMDASADSSDDGFVAKASDFLSMEIAGTTTVKLSFRGGQDRDGVRVWNEEDDLIDKYPNHHLNPYRLQQ